MEHEWDCLHDYNNPEVWKFIKIKQEAQSSVKILTTSIFFHHFTSKANEIYMII